MKKVILLIFSFWLFNQATILAQSCIVITQPDALTSGIVGTNVSCKSGNNGAANLTAAGGTTPYAYLWSNGATTEDLTNIVAGAYAVTVTDANLCISVANVIITEPTQLTADLTKTNVSCNGGSNGSVNLTAGGGTTAYTFLWSNAATTEDLSNVTAGAYTVTVTDANLCTVSASIAVTQPFALASAIVGTDVLCNGNATGAANLTVTNGTAPYTFIWSNGATTEDLTNIVAGTYNVTITDNNSCTKTDNVTITQPTVLTAGLSKTDVSCNGGSNGSVNLTAGGGTITYTFLWSNGATTEDLSNVAAGAYTVTVTDAHLCTASASITVTQPFALTSAIAGTNVLCNGNLTGAADLTVTEGTAPYTFVWSNGATTEDLTNIAAGTYNVTVTDSHGCTKTDNVTITQPTVLTAGLSKTDVSCNGGSNGTVNLTSAGGTTAYTFLWSNGATTEDLSGVVAGAYTVTVTDAHLCTVSASITVTQPFALTSAIAGTNVLCNGNLTGAADLTVSEGTAPYTFIWSNGTTTEDLTNIAAGTYNVTVTDANGCTKTDNVTITQPTALSFTTTQANVKCFGESNGSVTITGNGGATPYSYSLDDAATFPNTTGTFNSLSAGTYKPAVKDANGCITKCQ